ncbi:MAG TPA: hypothetical protein VGB79_01820 [Allosphingosinicella sp.]|jgi:hypothetical protein
MPPQPDHRYSLINIDRVIAEGRVSNMAKQAGLEDLGVIPPEVFEHALSVALEALYSLREARPVTLRVWLPSLRIRLLSGVV